MTTVKKTMLSGFWSSALSVRFVIKRVYFLSVCVHLTDNVIGIINAVQVLDLLCSPGGLLEFRHASQAFSLPLVEFIFY